MNQTFSKVFLFINIIFLSQSWAVSEQRVTDFERDCLNTEKTYTQLELDECALTHEELSVYLNEEDPDGIVTASTESPSQCLMDEGSPEPEGLEGLSEEIAMASTKLQCSPEDQEMIESSCGDQLLCNVGRSAVKFLRSVRASRLADTTKAYFANRVESGQAERCTDEGSSDCGTEIITALIANTLGTINSLRDVTSSIGSSIKSAIWGRREYLESKSNNLHEMASSSFETIRKIRRMGVGPFIMEKFRSFKSSVNSWMMSEVFCQEWKREPHAIPTEEERRNNETTTCKRPMTELGCLSCNDGLNAFCAAAGVFISEGALAMVTAGAATGLRVGVRASAVALRGSRAITEKVPLISRMTTPPTARRGIASVSDEAVVATSRTARAGSRLQNVKRVVDAFTEKVGSLKVVRLATSPIRAVDTMASNMVSRVTVGAASLTGQGRLTSAIRISAKRDIRESRQSGRFSVDPSQPSKRVVDPSGATGPRRIITGTRFLRRSGGPNHRSSGDRALTGDQASGGSQSSNPNEGQGGSESSSSDPIEGSRSREGSSSDDEGSSREQRSATQQEADRRRESEDQRRNQEEDEEERRRREQALAGAKTSSRRTNPALAATRAALVADVALKGASALENGAQQVAEKMLSEEAISEASGVSSGESPAIGSGDFKSAVEARVGESFSDAGQASQFAQNMNDIYSDSNREASIVDGFVKERGLSRDQARKAYNSEKEFYGQAARELSGSRRSGRFAQASTGSTRTPSSISSAFASSSSMDSNGPSQEEIIDVATSIGRIKQSISDMQEESERLDREEVAEAQKLEPSASVSALSPESEASQRASSSRRIQSSGFVASALAASTSLPASEEDFSGENNQEATKEQGSTISERELGETKQSEEALKQEQEAQNLVEAQKKRLALQFRIERSNLLSDLMNLLSLDKTPQFRILNKEEVSLLSGHTEKLGPEVEMDSVRTLDIKSQGQSYKVFKDLLSGKSIIIESSGRLVEGIPTDLL